MSVKQVRGKFVVTRLSEVNYLQKGGRIIELGAVYKDPKSEENTLYHSATPSGKIEMTVDNPAAAEFFMMNRNVYVDFTSAEE